MHYKTIVLELIQEHPRLHDQLRANKALLSTVNCYARDLKIHHEAWMDELRRVRPQSDPSQIASEALEIALENFRESLRSGSPPDETEEPLSLDAAMAFLRRHTPPA